MSPILFLTFVLIQSSCCENSLNIIDCGTSRTMADPSADCSKKDRILNRIVSGMEASIDELPWMASLTIGTYCGAVIIDELWLLTAAHCLYSFEQKRYMDRVNVRIGSTNKLRDGQLLSVKNFLIHPEYIRNGYITYDIALIELKNKISFNTSFANRVCIPNTIGGNKRPESSLFAGWGNTGIDGSKPTNILKKAFYSTIPPKQCEYKTDYFICVNASQGQGCQGDSGSPLIKYNGCKAILMGVFSYAKRYNVNLRCGPGLLIFVRVSKHIQWIQSLIGDLNSSGLPSNSSTTEGSKNTNSGTTHSTTEQDNYLNSGTPDSLNLYSFLIYLLIAFIYY